MGQDNNRTVRRAVITFVALILAGFVALILAGLAELTWYTVEHAVPPAPPTTYTVEVPVDCPAEDDCVIDSVMVRTPTGTHWRFTVTRIEH